MANRPQAASFAVLMTATIAPRGRAGEHLVRADPAQRLRDYEAALRFWLALPAPWMAGVVFGENSCSSVETLRHIAAEENPYRRTVEFLAFDHPPAPEGLHYGYSEMILVREAVRTSSLIAAVPYFIKATGRYTFPEIGRLVHRLPLDFKVAVDCKHSRLFSRQRHFLTHFALAVFQRDFFNTELAGIPERMIPAPPWTRAQFVENMLFDTLAPRQGEPGILLRWPCNCEPAGIGGNGDNYRSPRKRAQAAVKAIGRVFVPGVWL